MVFSPKTVPGGITFKTYLLSFLLLLFTISPPLPADTIHFTNGRTLTGIVDENLSNDTIVVISTSSGTMRIPRARIESIEVRTDVSEHERRGDLSLNDQDFDSALSHYLKAYEENPDSQEVERKIAETKGRIKERDDKRFGIEFDKIDELIELRKYEEAVLMGTQLAEKADTPSVRQSCMNKVADAYLDEARDYQNTVNYPQAEAAYRRAFETNPGGALAQLELASMIRRYPTRYDETFELYKQGLDLASKDPTLLEPKAHMQYRFDYAELHLQASRNREAAHLAWTIIEDDAKELFNKAFDIAIRACLSLKDELVEDTDENREIMDILQGLAEHRESDDKSNYILGKTFYEREEHPKAVGFLEKALVNMGTGYGNPYFAECRFQLALSYRRIDRDRDAITQLNALLELQAGRYDALCELGEIYFDLSDYENALKQFQEGVNNEPSQYRAFVGAGRTLRRVNQFDKAVLMYEELVKLRDDNPEYFFELGQSYAAVDRHENARKTYLKVIELMAGRNQNSDEVKAMMSDVYTNLGMTSVALKRYNESIEQFDKALRNNSEYAKALNGKGIAYRELSQLDNAEKFFKLSASADPENPEYTLSLGVLYHKFRKDTQTALAFYQEYYAKGGSDPQVADWIRECGGQPPA